MGCWAIGGAFYNEGTHRGYANSDDAESARAIHAAIEAGIRFFDTAAVYGAGHSERVLGAATAGRDDVLISTKIGIAFDEQSRQVTGLATGADDVLPAIEASLRRLARDHIDLLFLHVNTLPINEAAQVFDAMDRAVLAGQVRSYGWSTDFPTNVEAFASRASFQAVQHCANVLFSAPLMFPVVESNDLISVARSPLAMGVLTGKFSNGQQKLGDDDIRSSNWDWMEWFRDGEVAAQPAARLDAIRDCLQVGGRTLAQGAIAWLWGRSANVVPIPGFRTAHQVAENTGAIELGPLPADVMADIETLIDRSHELELRAR